MKVYLVRHGESEANTEGLFSGFTDTPLTDKGRKQAEGVAIKLSAVEFQKIYSSPLSRAFDTAKSIAKFHNNKIESLSGLKEENFGKCEGLSYVQIQERYPELIKDWTKNPFTFIFPQGESLTIMYERVRETYHSIIDDFKGENLLIVAHSGVIRSILTSEISEKLDHYWKYRIDNCTVTILEYSDNYKILNALNS